MHSLCHSLQTATPTPTVLLQSPLAATLQSTLQSAMKTAMLQTAVKLAMLQKRLNMALLQSTHVEIFLLRLQNHLQKTTNKVHGRERGAARGHYRARRLF